MVADVLVIAEAVKLPGELQLEPEPMVKLVLEISKKIFPTASIFILAVVVGVLGIVTASLPSLAVLATRVLKVVPPSVEMDIFTLAQLTGAAVVLATFQVMVWEEPPAHDTAVLGDVTENGPDELVTVTVISAKLVCATLTGADELKGALSLTVNRK